MISERSQSAVVSMASRDRNSRSDDRYMYRETSKSPGGVYNRVQVQDVNTDKYYLSELYTFK
jgi:hypothetical protein